MITEVYIEVSAPGASQSIYDKLDLYSDENIVIKYNIKDSGDIKKVFSTYSQTFTVPQSDRNNLILNYPFNTAVTRTAIKYINAKLYINHQLMKVGKVSVSQGSYKMGDGASYTLQFFTALKTMKDLVGDDMLTKMGATQSFVWDYTNVYDRMVNGTNEDLLVPLISNKRVWTYNTGAINDIKWVNSSATVAKSITIDELRPMIKFKYVMDAIIDYYKLNIDCPLFSRSEYTNLYIYGTSNILATPPTVLLANGNWTDYLYYPLYLNPPYGTPTAHNWDITSTGGLVGGLPTGTHSLTYNSAGGQNFNVDGNRVTFILNLYTQLVLPTPEVVTVEVTYVDERTATKGNILRTVTLTDVNISDTSLANFKDSWVIKPSDFGGIDTVGGAKGPLKFSIRIVASTSLTWNSVYEISSSTARNFIKTRATYYMKNSASNLAGESGLNYLKAIPDMKVIDFISSFFKMFNIKVIEDRLKGDLMYWNTPSDFVGIDKDFTPYVDIEKHTVATQDIYSKYILTHKQPKYKSSMDYKSAMVGNTSSNEYGQLIYSVDNPIIKSEYKVETAFSIIPPVIIPATQVETYYGFDSSSGTADATFTTVYKPNYGEMTLFYNNGPVPLYDEFGQGITFSFRADTVSKSFMTFSLFSQKDNLDEELYTTSLGFKDEINIEPAFIFEKNLFTNYYKDLILNLNEDNCRLFTYKAYLPTKEIMEFDLRNQIIIGDKKYNVETAEINIITGEAKLMLINIPLAVYGYQPITYVPPYVPPAPILPTNPTTFSASGDILLSWLGAYDVTGIQYYEISYKPVLSATWSSPLITSWFSYNLTLAPDNYDFRLRTRNNNNDWSADYIYTTYDTTYGVDSTPPTEPTSIYAYSNFGQYYDGYSNFDMDVYLDFSGASDNVAIDGHELYIDTGFGMVNTAYEVTSNGFGYYLMGSVAQYSSVGVGVKIKDTSGNYSNLVYTSIIA